MVLWRDPLLLSHTSQSADHMDVDNEAHTSVRSSLIHAPDSRFHPPSELEVFKGRDGASVLAVHIPMDAVLPSPSEDFPARVPGSIGAPANLESSLHPVVASPNPKEHVLPSSSRQLPSVSRPQKRKGKDQNSWPSCAQALAACRSLLAGHAPGQNITPPSPLCLNESKRVATNIPANRHCHWSGRFGEDPYGHVIQSGFPVSGVELRSEPSILPSQGRGVTVVAFLNPGALFDGKATAVQFKAILSKLLDKVITIVIFTDGDDVNIADYGDIGSLYQLPLKLGDSGLQVETSGWSDQEKSAGAARQAVRQAISGYRHGVLV
ncbi:hypothetical protein B0H14DRAFT_3510047 [Mycena olivaceomarginata]|nr:hypothetical protein B0H14DRAFT_3510047 [Mycena olivaceomarginata]